VKFCIILFFYAYTIVGVVASFADIMALYFDEIVSALY